MKALLLDAVPVGDAAVLPVPDPLWVPGFVDANAVRHRPAPYAGRVALSVPCPTCDGGRISPASYVYLRTPCPTCQGKGRLITHTAMVKFRQFVMLHDVYHFPPQWAAVLTDVRPTTERCPACWGEGERSENGRPVDQCIRCSSVGTCPPIPHDGGEEWEP